MCIFCSPCSVNIITSSHDPWNVQEILYCWHFLAITSVFYTDSRSGWWLGLLFPHSAAYLYQKEEQMFYLVLFYCSVLHVLREPVKIGLKRKFRHSLKLLSLCKNYTVLAPLFTLSLVVRVPLFSLHQGVKSLSVLVSRLTDLHYCVLGHAADSKPTARLNVTLHLRL